MSKLLTVAMPCYNVEQYLERGLSSFCDERLYDAVEVLIINDGSTDSTAKIAQKYADDYPQVFKLINKKNGGHGSGVNLGIREAAGKYFRVVDGDDWVNPDELANWIIFASDNDADLLVDTKTEVDMATMTPTIFPLPSYYLTWSSTRDCHDPGRFVQNFYSLCTNPEIESYLSIHTLAFKTEMLRSNEAFVTEGIFYEDSEYVVKGTCFAKSIAFTSCEVYQYLVGNASQSMAAQTFANRYKHHETVIRSLMEFEEKNARHFSKEIQIYLSWRIETLINTHYNVVLIYDENRAIGRAHAKEFRNWLEASTPKYAEATKKRYLQATALHYLGFDQEKLNKLMRR